MEYGLGAGGEVVNCEVKFVAAVGTVPIDEAGGIVGGDGLEGGAVG